ncbi:hypothetical protein [Streptomyces guryensis]|uniref:Uncharacterized protein n=1 Tax=Streptomyces guryensis TaxID=2886947 RepID=A0A9Q3VRL4_9ACTN|nr:hypothetical protein [Streptomyces guryensis]MCD9876364.1 hypothetical protein [Streptomyces guryensis]
METAAVVLGAFREAAHDEPGLVGLGERLERSVARELEMPPCCCSGTTVMGKENLFPSDE